MHDSHSFGEENVSIGFSCYSYPASSGIISGSWVGYVTNIAYMSSHCGVNGRFSAPIDWYSFSSVTSIVSSIVRIRTVWWVFEREPIWSCTGWRAVLILEMPDMHKESCFHKLVTQTAHCGSLAISLDYSNRYNCTGVGWVGYLSSLFSSLIPHEAGTGHHTWY